MGLRDRLQSAVQRPLSTWFEESLRATVEDILLNRDYARSAEVQALREELERARAALPQPEALLTGAQRTLHEVNSRLSSAMASVEKLSAKVEELARGKAAPTPEAPVAEAPVAEAPVTEAPVTEAPVTEAPVAEAPVAEAPVTEAPLTEAPVAEAPVAEAPVKAKRGRPTKAETAAKRAQQEAEEAEEAEERAKAAKKGKAAKAAKKGKAAKAAKKGKAAKAAPVETLAVEPVALDTVAVEPVALDTVAVEPVALDTVAVEPVAVALVEPVAFIEAPLDDAGQPMTERTALRRSEKGCKVLGCTEPHQSRGFCNRHYHLWRRNVLPGYVGKTGIAFVSEGERYRVWDMLAGKPFEMEEGQVMIDDTPADAILMAEGEV